MSTHNLCFEQKYKKYPNLYLKIFHFLVVKFSVYFNRHVFVMLRPFVCRSFLLQSVNICVHPNFDPNVQVRFPKNYTMMILGIM